MSPISRKLKSVGLIMKSLKLMKQVGVLLTIAFIVLCCSCSPPKPIEYEYTELFPDGWKPVGINNKGEVVGAVYDANGVFSKGFIYSNGEFTEPLPDGWQSAGVRAINDNGGVVGGGVDASGVIKIFIYSNGEFTELLPDGWQNAYDAWDINNNGEVVGNGVDTNRVLKFFIYSNGEFTELLPDGLEDPQAYHINNNGTVAGYGEDANGLLKFFIYSNEKYTIISQPYGVSNFCEVVDINDSGDFVVWLSLFETCGLDCSGNSFIYSNGKYTELVPRGVRNFRALAMNNNGDVIGKGYDKNTGGYKHYIYYNDGTYREVMLAVAGGLYESVVDINDYGEITGFVWPNNGPYKGFIAVPK